MIGIFLINFIYKTLQTSQAPVYRSLFVEQPDRKSMDTIIKIMQINPIIFCVYFSKVLCSYSTKYFNRSENIYNHMGFSKLRKACYQIVRTGRNLPL